MEPSVRNLSLRRLRPDSSARSPARNHCDGGAQRGSNSGRFLLVAVILLRVLFFGMPLLALVLCAWCGGHTPALNHRPVVSRSSWAGIAKAATTAAAAS